MQIIMLSARFSILIFALFIFLSILNACNAISVEKDLSLSYSEKKTLDQFRKKVYHLLYRDFMRNDIYLIRWLRARNFDMHSAEIMLREHLRWRKERKMDTILEEDWSDVFRDFHTTVDTFDKKDRPVGTLDIYDWDIRKGALQGKAKRVLRYLDHLMENLTMQVFEQQAKGYNVTQWKVLGQAEGFNIIEHGCPICLPFWVQFVQSVEANYVGWLDELIVVDAPPTVSIILDTVRPFLSRQTRDAIKIFSPNKQKWLHYLDARISKDQRRQNYGGTKP